MTLSASCDLCRASCFPKPRNKETSKPNHEISPAGVTFVNLLVLIREQQAL